MDLRKTAGSWISGVFAPILTKTRLTPDILSWLGLANNIIAAAAAATGHLIVAGFLVLFSGLFDILDGALARSTNNATLFGSFLDSTLDRVSESALLFGLLVLSMRSGNTIEILLIFCALIGSFLVSYVRARAEGLGIECRVGLFTRTERVIILALGLFFNQILIALIVLVVFSFITFGQRVVYVWRRRGIDNYQK